MEPSITLLDVLVEASSILHRLLNSLSETFDLKAKGLNGGQVIQKYLYVGQALLAPSPSVT
ncbi:hypothetical protein J1614_001807 [Plenodomus biglobosus]|nr:hypothetical protein J1614_001807 [Plenodomus biglobosus]